MKSSRLIILLFLLSLLLVYCRSRKHSVTVAPPVTVTEPTAQEPANDIRDVLSGGQIEQVKEGIKVTFSSEVLFPVNSSILTKDAVISVGKLGEMIKASTTANEILVSGHTDNTGTSAYNKWLSERRASSVKTALVKAGVNGNHIKTTGYGDSKPVASNNTPEDRAKNRRVEVLLVNKTE